MTNRTILKRVNLLAYFLSGWIFERPEGRI